MTPGVVSTIDCCSKSPRSSLRRSMRPCSPNSVTRLAGSRVKAIEKIHYPGKDAASFAVGPVRHSARRLGAANPGVELPLQLSRCSVQRHHFLRRRVRIKRPAHDQRIDLEFRPFRRCRRSTPRLQPANVGAVDLRQRSNSGLIGAAVVCAANRRLLRAGRDRRMKAASSTTPRAPSTG